MSTIEMVCRRGTCRYEYCDYRVRDYYSIQCHTGIADVAGCPYYADGGKNEAIPYGGCVHAVFDTFYKGTTAKNYKIEGFCDAYNPHLDCARVTIGKNVYECDKVILNGELVYSNERRHNE